MRKLTKQVLMLALAGLVAGFTTCKEQPQNKKNNSNHEVLSEDMQGLTFTIALPGEAAVEVDTRAIHVVDEWAIDQLWVYEFDRDGAKLLKEPVDVKDKLNYTGNEAKFTYTIDGLTEGAVRTFFVANTEKVGTKGQSLTDIQNIVLAKKLATESKNILTPKGTDPLPTTGDGFRIPMTGVAMDGGSANIAYGPNSTAKVELTRVVARIDIINKMPELTINEISLHKAFNESYLHTNHGETRQPSLAQRVDNIKPFKAVDPAGLVGALNGSKKKEGVSKP